jgi:hypothetical protein
MKLHLQSRIATSSQPQYHAHHASSICTPPAISSCFPQNMLDSYSTPTSRLTHNSPTSFNALRLSRVPSRQTRYGTPAPHPCPRSYRFRSSSSSCTDPTTTIRHDSVNQLHPRMVQRSHHHPRRDCNRCDCRSDRACNPHRCLAQTLQLF